MLKLGVVAEIFRYQGEKCFRWVTEINSNTFTRNCTATQTYNLSEKSSGYNFRRLQSSASRAWQNYVTKKWKIWPIFYAVQRWR